MRAKGFLIALALCASVVADGADTEKRNERETGRATRRATKVDIDKHIKTINRLDNNRAALMAGMAMVSKETAVPLPSIQTEHKENPATGLAGLFVAHDLAVHTHKDVAHFINAHKQGRSWNEIAQANGQNLDEIDAKLSRIEQTMQSAK